MSDNCKKLEQELNECRNAVHVLLEKFTIARFAPDLLTDKIRLMQEELDKRDGVAMFPEFYKDVR
jgi:hypothetical protein